MGIRGSVGRARLHVLACVVVMGLVAGVAPAGAAAPSGAQAGAAQGEDPRGDWRPFSESGDREVPESRSIPGVGVPQQDPPPAAQPAGPPPERVRELTGQRSAKARVFEMSDGTRQAELSPTPLHYRAGDGSWQPIDTAVGESQRPGFGACQPL